MSSDLKKKTDIYLYIFRVSRFTYSHDNLRYVVLCNVYKNSMWEGRMGLGKIYSVINNMCRRNKYTALTTR